MRLLRGRLGRGRSVYSSRDAHYQRGLSHRLLTESGLSTGTGGIMREKRGIALVAVSAVFLVGCYKSTPATADSAAASSTTSGASFDRDAASAQILANDSTFVRGMMTKNVDTVMCC